MIVFLVTYLMPCLPPRPMPEKSSFSKVSLGDSLKLWIMGGFYVARKVSEQWFPVVGGREGGRES